MTPSTEPGAESAAPAPEISPVDAEAVDAAVQAALAAFASADDLDELKAARLAHTGDRAPLTLANKGIGALPKERKAEAGKVMGAARGRMNKALAARTAVLEAEHAERILREETVDVTAAVRRRRPGARHPLSLTAALAMAQVLAAEGPALQAGLNAATERLVRALDALSLIHI